MKRVVVESPYAGDVKANKLYAQKCIFDCLQRGESPYASHLLLTQVLDDNNPEERVKGIQAGYAWSCAADCIVFYVDLGFSNGMTEAYKRAADLGLNVEIRALWSKTIDVELPDTGLFHVNNSNLFR